MNTSLFDVTMNGLETGLQVQHIATSGQDLRFCNIDDDRDIVALFSDPEFEGFDYLPVRKENSTIGVVARGDKGSIASFRKLDESNLISAQEPLRHLFRLMETTSYRLVLKGASIQGIVTRSDLLKLPVRLFVFTLVTHLEILMRDIIRAKYPVNQDDKWFQILKPRRQEKAKAKQQELTSGNYELPLLECTDFCDKRDIVKDICSLTEKFKKDLEAIENNLRNKVAHGGDYAHNDEEMQRFIKRVILTEYWVKELQNYFTQIPR